VGGGDELRRVGLVAERHAQLADDARQGGLGDDAAGPDAVEQLGLGDQPAATGEQDLQQREGLRCERHHLSVATQLALRQIGFEGTEAPVRRRSH
jgi:hypothetical protein